MGHTGIQKAADAAFLGASWQMCQVHCTRAVLRNIPRKHQKGVVEALKEVYGMGMSRDSRTSPMT